MVDFLRSAYSTTCRFFPDRPDIETVIQWYFVDDDARVLDLPTVFRSRNWTDYRGDFVPLLGEIKGAPRQWEDGLGPPVSPRGIRCGPESAWLSGIPGDPTLPLDTDVWGEPRCCFPFPYGPCPALAAANYANPEIAYALAVAIFAVYAEDLTQLNILGNQLAHVPTTTAHSFHIGGDVPDWAAWWDANQVVVAIAGTQSESLFLEQFVSSFAAPVDEGGFSMGTVPGNVAHAVAAELGAAGVPTDRPIIFAGHSLGGSVATYLLAREKQLRPSRVSAAITFGEPKAFDERVTTYVTGSHFRLETLGDVVSYVPPNVGLLPWILPFLPLSIPAAWNQYARSSGGLRILPDGSYVMSDPIDPVTGDLTALVAQCMNHMPPALSNDHLIQTYAEYLQAAVLAAPFTYMPSRCLDMPTINSVFATLMGLSPFPPEPIAVWGGGNVSGGALFFGPFIPRIITSGGGNVQGGAIFEVPAVITPAGGAGGGGAAVWATTPHIVVSGGGSGGGEATITVFDRLLVDGGGNVGGGAEWGSTGSEEFFADGVWRRPPGVSAVTVLCRGAGGGGGSGLGFGFSFAGSGGGGGAFAEATFAIDTSRLTFPVTVAPSADQDVGGGDSYFDDGSLVLAKGGSPGVQISGGVAAGGLGGQDSACIGDFAYSGGNGADTGFTDGGGGGAGAGDANVGGDALLSQGGTGGVAGGGDGGNGSTSTSGAGDNGLDIGGAGGGGGSQALGGRGAAGRVIVQW